MERNTPLMYSNITVIVRRLFTHSLLAAASHSQTVIARHEAIFVCSLRISKKTFRHSDLIEGEYTLIVLMLPDAHV